MRERLFGALIQGDKVIWSMLAALWALTAVLVVFRRSSYSKGAPATLARVLALLGATSVTSLLAFPLVNAVAIPRIHWKTVDAPELRAPTGDTWRTLRGPAASVIDHGMPDVAIPTLDAQDQWVLVGLLSGRPIEGFAPAPEAPIETSAPRICRAGGAACRPWPESWPNPTRPIGKGELVWRKEASPSALAYDPETNQYLETIADLSEPGAALGTGAEAHSPAVLELLGRIANDPAREGTSVLFVLKRVANDRLRAVRVVAVSSANGKTFHLQRSDVSLTAGPRIVRWFARPALLLTSFAFPIGLLVVLYMRRRRAGAGAEGGGDALSQRSSGRLNALSAIATLAAGVAAGAPAVVAIVSMWGSR